MREERGGWQERLKTSEERLRALAAAELKAAAAEAAEQKERAAVAKLKEARAELKELRKQVSELEAELAAGADARRDEASAAAERDECKAREGKARPAPQPRSPAAPHLVSSATQPRVPFPAPAPGLTLRAAAPRRVPLRSCAPSFAPPSSREMPTASSCRRRSPVRPSRVPPPGRRRRRRRYGSSCSSCRPTTPSCRPGSWPSRSAASRRTRSSARTRGARERPCSACPRGAQPPAPSPAFHIPSP